MQPQWTRRGSHHRAIFDFALTFLFRRWNCTVSFGNLGKVCERLKSLTEGCLIYSLEKDMTVGHLPCCTNQWQSVSNRKEIVPYIDLISHAHFANPIQFLCLRKYMS